MSKIVQQGTIVPITAGSGYFTSQYSGYIHNSQPGRGVKLFINVTSAGSGSITPVITYTDANGIDYPALSGAAISANGKYVQTIYPTAIAAATNNTSLNDAIPKTFHVDIQANNSNVIKYSAAYSLLE